MNRNKLLLSISLMILGTAAACNLPTRAGKVPDGSQQAAATVSMEDLVKTAQAEDTSVSSQPSGEDKGDEELMISRDHNAIQQEVQSDPTEIPTATPDPNRKPPELPAVFQTDLLNPLDTPHEYEDDICKVIKNRWGAGKAAPGTVVMVVMYHGIAKGATQVQQDNAVTADKHNQFMRNLHDQGFTAINTEQFIAFMENNDWIPERSALIIVDDRHT